ncbi:MAG: MFS transporter [Anaerolineae bacterium]|nr:MFS transporter [Anaerolineae bacterium]
MHLSPRYKWFIVGVFLAFMLLHQADKLLIGQVLTDIQRDFQIDDAQAGAIGTGALVVAAIFYPLWGYLYDRYARARLLALASFIWGVTTALSAIAPNFGSFLATRASTGVDDASYPGLYSLVADYFGPKTRGRVFGLLQLTAPLGFVLSLVLVLALDPLIGWRNIFLLTGGLGLVVGLFIFFGVRDLPRGRAEPELENLPEIAAHRFDWVAARSLLKKRALLPMFVQGFFGVFPLNVITFWFFTYLERERGFESDVIFPIMAGAVLAMSVGAFFAGWLGDRLFQRTPRGRLLVSTTGVMTSTVLLFITLSLPPDTTPLIFGIMLALTALFVLFSGSNVAATIQDITQPEVRSTALSVQYFVENIGAASAPLLVGALSNSMGLSSAILLICVVTYVLCGVFLVIAVLRVPADVAEMRALMRERARESQGLASGAAAGD